VDADVGYFEGHLDLLYLGGRTPDVVGLVERIDDHQLRLQVLGQNSLTIAGFLGSVYGDRQPV
jgi:hypothetical protein